VSASDVLDRAVRMIERSQRALERGHVEEAIELLERAVALDVDRTVSRTMFEYLYRHRGPWSRPGQRRTRRPDRMPGARGARAGSASPSRRYGGEWAP
jgi:hypothetical protein